MKTVLLILFPVLVLLAGACSPKSDSRTAESGHTGTLESMSPRIVGTVKAGGVHLAGAKVELLPHSAGKFYNHDFVSMSRSMGIGGVAIQELTTDLGGNFVFDDVPLCSYVVKFSHPDYAIDYSDGITLHEGTTHKRAAIDLPVSHSVQGVILGPAGNPIAGATIEAHIMKDRTEGHHKKREFVCAQDGLFHFNQMKKGSYLFFGKAPSFGVAVQAIEINAESTETLTLTLKPEVLLQGRVALIGSDKPISGVEITALFGRTAFSTKATTDKNGRYMINGFGAGATLAINARHPRLHMDMSHEKDVSYMRFPQVQVKLKEDAAGDMTQNIFMTEGGRLEGRVVDKATGKGITGAEVHAIQAGRRSTFGKSFRHDAVAISGLDGHYVLASVNPGRVLVQARFPEFYSLISRDNEMERLSESFQGMRSAFGGEPIKLAPSSRLVRPSRNKTSS